MINARIAVPSEGNGGIEGKRSEHFGHCDVFTIVDVKDGVVTNSTTIDNSSHEHGGCMVPVTLLADNHVDTVIVVGIGRRPLIGFNDLNIGVYVDKVNLGIKATIDEFINNNLDKISINQSCGGGNCHSGCEPLMEASRTTGKHTSANLTVSDEISGTQKRRRLCSRLFSKSSGCVSR